MQHTVGNRLAVHQNAVAIEYDEFGWDLHRLTFELADEALGLVGARREFGAHFAGVKPCAGGCWHRVWGESDDFAAQGFDLLCPRIE